MTEIIVKTHKPFYSKGGKIYGSVYLTVESPTAGCGVKLRLIGQEKCKYHNVLKKLIPNAAQEVLEESNNFLYNEIVLYEFDGPISLGKYVFPFQATLPANIPGSFDLESTDGPSWASYIRYKVEAEVLEAENTKAEQSFVICEACYEDSEAEDNPMTKQVSGTCRFLGLQRGNLSVTAKLDKHVYAAGNTAKLNLEFETTGAFSLKVKSLEVKLFRELILVFRTQLSNSRDSPMPPQVIHPENENGNYEIWQTSIPGGKNVNLNRGLKNILIPLETQSGSANLSPSVNAHHIQCHYSIAVTVEHDNGNDINLKIPIPHLLPALHIMPKSKCLPAWTNSCQLLRGNQECFVRKKVLESDIFQDFPSVQTSSLPDSPIKRQGLVMDDNIVIV